MDNEMIFVRATEEEYRQMALAFFLTLKR